MNRKFGRNDVILLIALGIFCVLGMMALTFFQKPGAQAEITVDGASYGIYSLREDQEIPVIIEGVITNQVVISGGKVQMEEADCPDQICVRQHAISTAGESIVCLPNRVVVTIRGAEESEFDAMVR